MIFEGMGYDFRTMTLEFIARMNRKELVEWLEFRGMAVYEDEPIELLRNCAVEDFGDESMGEE